MTAELRVTWEAFGVTVSQFSGLPFGEADRERLVASSLPCAIKWGGILPAELLLLAGFGSVFAPHALAVGMRIYEARERKREREKLKATTGTASVAAGPKPAAAGPPNGAVASGA